jgi:hypothetical protein
MIAVVEDARNCRIGTLLKHETTVSPQTGHESCKRVHLHSWSFLFLGQPSNALYKQFDRAGFLREVAELAQSPEITYVTSP